MWRLFVVLIPVSLFVSASGNPETEYQAAIRTYRENKPDSTHWYADHAIARYLADGKTDSLVLARMQKALAVWDTEGLDAAFAFMDTTLQFVERLPTKHVARVAAYGRMGQLHTQRYEFAQATAFFRQAEQAAGNHPNSHTVNLYNHLAVMHFLKEDYLLARHYADLSYVMNLELEGRDGATMPMVLQTRFLISHYSEDFAQALKEGEEFQRVTRLHYPPYHPRIGTMHTSLAIIHETLRQYEDAMSHRRMAVDIHTRNYAESSDGFSLASAYQNIGYLYGYLHEPFLAQEYLEKGIRLLERTFGRDGLGMAKPLADIAVHKHKAGKHAEATALFGRALGLQQQHAPADRLGLAYVEGFIAEALLDQGDYAEAASLFQSVFEHYAHTGAGDSENALLVRFSLARALAGLGRYGEALALQEPILTGIRRIYPTGSDAIAFKSYGFSDIYLQMGQLERAYAMSDSVFCELMRLTRLPEDFSEWFTRLPFSYHTMLYVAQRAEILFQTYEHSQDRQALETLLRLADTYSGFVSTHLHVFRSQAALVDLGDVNKRIYNLAIEAGWALSENGTNETYNELAFVYAERAKALLMRLATNNMLLDEQQPTARDVDFLRDQAFRKQISTLNTQYLDSNRNSSLLMRLSTTMEDYRLFQDSLKKAGNTLFSSRYRLDIPDLADIRTNLLTRDETVLEYAVTDRSVFTFVLTQTDLYVHRTGSKIVEDVSLLREFHGLSAEEFVPPAYRLYTQLIQPVEDYFTGKRILIVPDADLYYLNFEVLLRNDNEYRFSNMPFLIYRYEISHLLSATSAVQFKKIHHNPHKKGKALLFAPVFTDEMKENYRNSLPDQDVSENNYSHVFRQPFTLQTAKNVGRRISHDLFSEQQAEERLFKQAAPDYHVLHLGTHAEVNNHSPLHSRLYFAKAMHNDTTNTDDGYLHAYELYSMQLRAEMAVLTACQTGAGTWRNGEGVISLAHGFMHAGCPSVIMTLWKVDEQTSSSLITKFYEYLSKGHDKSRALRRAKLDLLSNANERQAHPYYWAGLSLVGDPTPIYTNTSWRNWTLALIALAGIGWLLGRERKRREITR